MKYYVGKWMIIFLVGVCLLGSCGNSLEGESRPADTQEGQSTSSPDDFPEPGTADAAGGVGTPGAEGVPGAGSTSGTGDVPESGDEAGSGEASQGSIRQEAGVTEVPIGEEVLVNLSREGVTEDTVRIYQGAEEEEYGTMVPVCVEVNGQILETEDRFEWLISSYLIRQPGGKTYLIFDTDYMSADYVTHLYELTDGEIRRASEPVGRASIGAVDTETVLLRETLDVLGTYWPERLYSIGETGELVRQEGLYYMEPYEYQIMTVIRELPVLMDGQETTLPAGTRLRIIATDNEGTAWFRTEAEEEGMSGEEGEIHYTRQDYEIMIAGVSEYEYFDMIPYSG